MHKPFVHGVGGVLSADLAVPDHERELDFYSTILTTGDAPLWRDDLTNNFGTPIIGLGVCTPEYNTLPLQWIPHFQVADVATSVTRAIDMGGKELWPQTSLVNSVAVTAICQNRFFPRLVHTLNAWPRTADNKKMHASREVGRFGNLSSRPGDFGRYAAWQREMIRNTNMKIHGIWAFGLLLIFVFTASLIAQEAAGDEAAVRRAVLDYVEGVYDVRPELIERSVDPNLNKLGFWRPSGETEFKDGSVMTYDELKELAASYNKEGMIPKDAVKEITVFEVMDKIATAKLVAAWGVDYFHLVKQDDDWKILQIVWQSQPKK